MYSSVSQLQKANKKIWDNLFEIRERLCAITHILSEQQTRITEFEGYEMKVQKLSMECEETKEQMDETKTVFAKLSFQALKLKVENDALKNQNEKLKLELAMQNIAIPSSPSPPVSTKMTSETPNGSNPLTLSKIDPWRPDVIPQNQHNTTLNKEYSDWVNGVTSKPESGNNSLISESESFESSPTSNQKFKGMEADKKEKHEFLLANQLKPIGSQLGNKRSDDKSASSLLFGSGSSKYEHQSPSITPTTKANLILPKGNKTTPGKRMTMAMTLKQNLPGKYQNFQEFKPKCAKVRSLSFEEESGPPKDSSPAISDIVVQGLFKGLSPQDVLKFFVVQFGKATKFWIPPQSRFLPDGTQYMFIRFDDAKIVNEIMKKEFYTVKGKVLKVGRGRWNSQRNNF